MGIFLATIARSMPQFGLLLLVLLPLLLLSGSMTSRESMPQFVQAGAFFTLSLARFRRTIAAMA